MTRALRGRLGRIALLIVGLVALLAAGAAGVAMEARAGMVIETAAAHCPGCDEGRHLGHDKQGGETRAAGCAASCVQPAIPAGPPLLPPVGMRSTARPVPLALSAGRSTLPEPEPPRAWARA